MKNKDLATFYNSVYKKGETKHYTSLLLSGDKVPMAKTEVIKEVSWKDKTVLDVGCGTGMMPYSIAKKGARHVLGIDYSKEAIGVARHLFNEKNLSFECTDISRLKGKKFDVITTLGTLEHVDDPLAVLRKLKSMLNPGGSLIVTCPNWVNPRGYMLQMLAQLFDANITLADIHFFTPIEFEIWAKKLGMDLKWKTVDQEWAHGKKCISDFKRRLPNVARDSKLPTDQKHIDRFLKWLETHMAPIEQNTRYGGAVGLYHLKRIG